MADIRCVTETFAVAPQLAPEELAEAARQGFRLVINNRPDGESPDQPSSIEMAAAARQAGLEYLHIPVRGAPTANQAEAVQDSISGAEGPVLAFCRSGTRSIMAWAMGEASRGRSREELIRLGQQAGYDLSSVLP